MTIPLKIPVNPGMTPIGQIWYAIRRLGPRYCQVHRQVLLTPDIDATLRDAFDPVEFTASQEDSGGLTINYTRGDPPRHLYSVSICFMRCPGCPLSREEPLERGEADLAGAGCAVFSPDMKLQGADNSGIPVPVSGFQPLLIDPYHTEEEHLKAFRSKWPKPVCKYLGKWSYRLRVKQAQILRDFSDYEINGEIPAVPALFARAARCSARHERLHIRHIRFEGTAPLEQ